MIGSQSGAAEEFELTVEVCADARPLPGFHATRTRTFFVDNHGRVFLVAAPGQRAMLLQVDALPASAERTSDVDPGLKMMARAAQALGRGQHELTTLRIADYFAWRTRLFRVHAGRVFELRRDPEDVRFAAAPVLPAGAVPFTEAEVQLLGGDVHQAARLIDAN